MLKHRLNSARGPLVLGLVVCFFLLSLAVVVTTIQDSQEKGTELMLGNKEYTVQVVSSASDRQKGLSGTDPLARDQGMLFDFGEDGQWGIWMKDMNYPIDILWIDQSKTIVHIVENAQPSSYPATTFRPEKPARYVLELATGSVRDSTVSIGSQVAFDSGGSGERK